jgi:hypothetical protein
MTGQRIIDSTDKPASLAGEWLVAVVFGALVLPVAGIAFSPGPMSGETALKWIAGIFLLAALGNVCRLTFRTLDVFRFGRIRLHLRATPVTLGGALEGELEFPRKASSLKDVIATLACTRIIWRGGSGPGGGGGATRSDEDIWTVQQRLELVVRGPRGRAVLRFDIPAGQPDSAAHSSSGLTLGVAKTVDHAWELRLRAAAPGLNLERRFPITVLANVGPHAI